MKLSLFLLITALPSILVVITAAESPQAEISNGRVTARVCLPDPIHGFYRGTRFDWAGVILALEAGRHTYFKQWFRSHDPAILDVSFVPALDGFAAGTPSASVGPVEEFSSPVGYDEAPVGGTFIKIGVGVLRKPHEKQYAWYTRYEIVDPGKWTVERKPDSIEFRQEINAPSGYSYVYRKTIRLPKGRAEMVLDHSFRNTGSRRIESPVYCHNFLVMDDQPSGPDFSIKVPFEIANDVDKLGVLIVRGRELAFAREIHDDERAMIAVSGFGGDSKDYDIRVENRKTGAGVRITSDRPLSKMMVWAVRPTLCPEPFIDVRVEPGTEFTWRIAYDFYSLHPDH